RARHLFNSVLMPAFSVASTPSNSSDIDALIYPKAQITQIVVQRMQVVVQKIQVNHCSALNINSNRRPTNAGCWPSTASKRKESTHEKVRSMPWKAGIRCPLP